MINDKLFTFITTDKDFAKKAISIANEIKNGTKENKIKSWFELIYAAVREYGRVTNRTFGIYEGTRNVLAKRLIDYYC